MIPLLERRKRCSLELAKISLAEGSRPISYLSLFSSIGGTKEVWVESRKVLVLGGLVDSLNRLLAVVQVQSDGF